MTPTIESVTADLEAAGVRVDLHPFRDEEWFVYVKQRVPIRLKSMVDSIAEAAAGPFHVCQIEILHDVKWRNDDPPFDTVEIRAVRDDGKEPPTLND